MTTQRPAEASVPPPTEVEAEIVVPPPPTMSAEFKVLHESWAACLAGDDRNCIHRQVLTMIWNAAAFRVINESRRHVPKEDDGSLQANALMHHLLDQCFFESQLIAVRRLIDEEKISGARGVYSLRSLIGDMRKRRHLLTRSHLFAIAGLPMDFDAAARAHDAEVRKMGRLKPGAAFALQTWDPERIAMLHRTCDRLCGVRDPQARSANDQVSDAVFAGLSGKLDQLAPVKTAVDKFVAHAATIDSRARVDPAELSVTFGQLWRAHEVICRCCHFLDCYILRQNTMQFLASPSHNVLTYMEVPLATEAVKPDLERAWHEYERETESWTQTPDDWATSTGA